MRTDRPETVLAWNGDAVLAYQVLGSGSPDVLYQQGYLSNVELNWDHPVMAQFLRGLAAGRRLVMTDPRGNGSSERWSPSEVPPLELQMGDTLTVMDAVGSERAVIMANNEQAFVACMFAATYPERTIALILYEAAATFRWTPETPWEWTDEQWAAQEESYRRFAARSEGWLEELMSDQGSLAGDPEYVAWYTRYALLSGAMGAAISTARLYSWTDIRSILPAIHVPVLVLSRPAHPEQSWPQSAAFVAAHIPGARLVELPGSEAPLWIGSTPVHQAIDAFLAEIRREEAELDRVLATVLFTDIADSTTVASRLGDHAWAELVQSHHATVRALLDRYRGVEVDTAGDGFFATFDGPGRGVRCAAAIVDAVKPLGIQVRAGIHTGEVETMDTKVGGLAVNIGARVGGQAGPSEVLVTSTVKDLCAGSDLRFEDAGEHELKGVPDRWRLYRVASATAPY